MSLYILFLTKFNYNLIKLNSRKNSGEGALLYEKFGASETEESSCVYKTEHSVANSLGSQGGTQGCLTACYREIVDNKVSFFFSLVCRRVSMLAEDVSKKYRSENIEVRIESRIALFTINSRRSHLLRAIAIFVVVYLMLSYVYHTS